MDSQAKPNTITTLWGIYYVEPDSTPTPANSDEKGACTENLRHANRTPLEMHTFPAARKRRVPIKYEKAKRNVDTQLLGLYRNKKQVQQFYH